MATRLQVCLALLCIMVTILYCMHFRYADPGFSATSFLSSVNESSLFVADEVRSSPQVHTSSAVTTALPLLGSSTAADDSNSAPNPTVQLPGALHFLPHLVSGSLTPAFCLCGARRSNVSIALGVPTVRRAKTYLMTTLKSLVSSLTPEEREDAVIIVFVAETDLEYVNQLAAQLQTEFDDEVRSGLLEVISSPASYYPDMDHLQLTLGDPASRVRWRAKQNLDFAFLMMYAHTRATFYLQLEDDVLAQANFVTTMKNFALKTTAGGKPWLLIEFCKLGFIGKLFKSADLPLLAEFFILFYNDKPVDWLLDDILHTKACSPETNKVQCDKAKSELWIKYTPSPFEHIGTQSSLQGKIQNLKIC